MDIRGTVAGRSKHSPGGRMSGYDTLGLNHLTSPHQTTTMPLHPEATFPVLDESLPHLIFLPKRRVNETLPPPRAKPSYFVFWYLLMGYTTTTGSGRKPRASICTIRKRPQPSQHARCDPGSGENLPIEHPFLHAHPRRQRQTRTHIRTLWPEKKVVGSFVSLGSKEAYIYKDYFGSRHLQKSHSGILDFHGELRRAGAPRIPHFALGIKSPQEGRESPQGRG
ncbi:hypothetical protein BKA70DRAFT_1483310 [Coprinopsis sp. MPI-PUGE-AT-0042]|nr:hypothetical protein BKA70DRAFT_1483310 [Coprinopsis sp. MPI-PUGE-AT-0042]